MALLSIRGLYLLNNKLFDGLTLPTPADINTPAELVSDPPVLDKDALVKLLIFRLSELEVVYADPELMQLMIDIWSKTRFYSWTKLYETMLYKYNPIWNKDGSFTETRDLSRADQTSASGSGQSMHDVTGFDRNDYSNDTRDRTSSSTSASGSGTEKEKIVRTEAGNIGVTMTQEMIERQREVVLFNIYDHIIDEFKKEFCLMVY